MKEDNSIMNMGISSLIVFLGIFFPVMFLTGFWAAFKLGFFYVMLFYVPFLPLAYSFKELSDIERGFIANILGIGYVGIYAALDIFLKIKLEFFTYSIVTILIFCISLYFYRREK